MKLENQPIKNDRFNAIHKSSNPTTEYSLFLKLHAKEIQYMVPWSQYEENKIVNNKNKNCKRR